MIRNLTAPLAIGRFRRVWLGQLANVVGDAVYTVAIALYVLPRQDAPHALGIVLGMASLGGVFSMLIGGALADRHRRSRMIIISDLIRAAAVIGVVVAGYDAPLFVLGALAALLGLGSGLYRPAYAAILPTLVPAELLPGANSLRALVNRFGVIAGAAIAGILVTATNPSWALIADIATFAVSIATLIRLKEEIPGGGSRVSLAKDIGEGLTYVLRRPWMTGVMLQGTAHMALVAAPVALLLPLLTGPKGWFGYIAAAEAFGAFCGATIASTIKSRSPGWIAMLALFAQLPQTLLLAVDGVPVLILIASALAGMGLAVFAVIWTTSLQTGVPRGQLGRVFSVDQLTAVGLMPVGYVLAGWLLEGLGAGTLGWVASGSLIASILLVLPLPGIRKLADRTPIGQEATAPAEAA